jgi:hypothetical protein
MSLDKVSHNYRTPLKASYIVANNGISVSDFMKQGVIINKSNGSFDSVTIENKSSYYLTNDGTSILWKKPTWLEIDAPSDTTKTGTTVFTYPSAYRRITISQAAPSSFSGYDGDVWLTFV